jgi:hypothetical protein
MDVPLGFSAWLLGLFAILVGGGCTAHAPQRQYSGFLIRGFEQLQFRPCDPTSASAAAAERWLPVAKMPEVESFESVFRRQGADTLFVVVAGTLGKPVAVGHLGQLSRVITVQRIDSARRALPATCQLSVSDR